MDLNGLLNASLELEKRIKTDQILRQYLSPLLGKSNSHAKSRRPPTQTPGGIEEKRVPVEFEFPPEMCELLDLASNATGKSTVEILEESFADYFQKHFGDATK